MTRLSTIQRSQVIQLFNDGKSAAEIVRLTKFSRPFVDRWVAAAKEGRQPVDKPRPGSPRKLNQTDRLYIRAMLKGKKGRSTRKVAALFTARKHKAVSHESIRAVARQAGLKPYVKKSKPLLTDSHRQRRLNFVEMYRNINWRQGLFTDETTFVLFGRPNRKWKSFGKRIVMMSPWPRPSSMHPKSTFGAASHSTAKPTCTSSRRLSIPTCTSRS
jgi:transposase